MADSVRDMTAGQRVAWVCLHLIAVLVPLAMTNISFLNLPAASLTLDQFALIKVVLLRALVLVALASWLASLLVRGGAVRWVRVGWLAVAFAFSASLSTVFALDPIPSLDGAFMRREGLFTVVSYVAIFFLVLQLATSAARVRSLARTVVVTAGIVSFYGLIQAAGWDPLEWFGLDFDARMAFSTLGNPDLLGAYLVAPLCIAVGLVLTERDARWQWGYALCSLLVAGALVATFVRGAWLGAIAGILTLGVVLWRARIRLSRRELYAVGAVVLVVVIVAGLSLTAQGVERNVAERVTSAFNFGEGSVASRFLIWGAALEAIGARPLLGSGPDSFGLAYTSVEPAALVRTVRSMQIADNAHNVVLQYGVTLGLIGSILFVAFVLSGLWTARAVAFPTSAERSRLALAGFGAGIVGYLVYLLSGIADVGSAWLLWLSLGVVCAPLAASRELHAPRWGRVAAVLLLVAASIGIAWNLSLLPADFRYLKGTENPDPAGAVTELEAAVRLNPIAPHYWTALGSAHGRVMEQSAPVAPAGAMAAYNAALRAFDRATSISRHDYTSYVALAELNNRASYYLDPALASRGEAAALEAVRLRPNGAEPNYQLALARMQLGDLDGALEAARMAIGLVDTYADAQLLVAQVLEQKRDLVGAKEAYEQGLRLLPGDDERVPIVRQALAAVEASLSAGGP